MKKSVVLRDQSTIPRAYGRLSDLTSTKYLGGDLVQVVISEFAIFKAESDVQN
jgi:hypothetical protein